MLSVAVVKGPRAGDAVPGFPSDRRTLALHIAGIAVLALVLVSSDAFGSDDLPLSRRALMFGTVSALLVVQASFLADAARRLCGSSAFRLAAAAAAAMTATLLLMTIEIEALKRTPIVPYAPDPLPEFALFLMPFVVPVGALVLGLKWTRGRDAGTDRGRLPETIARDASAQVAIPGASRAAEDALGTWPTEPVRRVQAVDHYLHLWTSRGTMLVRCRMRDALGRLPASAGIQPHRSWWVSWSDIDRLERRGRDYALLLRNGDCVPVARARAIEVRRALVGRSIR